MMLPTTLPLLDIFRPLIDARPDRVAAARTADRRLPAGLGRLRCRRACCSTPRCIAPFARSDWLALNGWVIGALVLALAGLFQFSRLKYRCLDKCRTPLSFVA